MKNIIINELCVSIVSGVQLTDTVYFPEKRSFQSKRVLTKRCNCGGVLFFDATDVMGMK